jgi:hypothetical protein
LRRRIKAADAADDGVELLRLYDGLTTEEIPRFGIDVLRALLRVDPPAARPVLRQVIEDSGDAWLITFGLERVGECGLVELRDVVRTAESDPRRVVASTAVSVGKRLDKGG